MKVLKVILKVMVICFAAMGMIGVISSLLGNQTKKTTIKQLRYNLSDERAAREELEKQVKELQTELSRNTAELNANAQKSTEVTSGDSSLYLQAKFPSDGNYYVDSYQSKFYKDINCTEMIDNPRFMSCKIDESLESPSGFPIKAMRLDSGEICYCPRDALVYLVTEQEWNEYLKEQEGEE